MQTLTRRNFIKATSLGAVGMTLPHWLLADAPSKTKLNFVFLLVDDLGWRDLGCYGSTFYETPNIDRLATQGVRFTDAYAACPVCSPTRASIMTGKYPAAIGITDWIPGFDMSNQKLLTPGNQFDYLPLAEVTMAEAFKTAGYSTFFAGKWHLGGDGYLPEDQGFDVNIGGHRWGVPPGGYFSPYGNSKLRDGPEGEFLTDRLTDESLKFLDAHKNMPFLLFLSYYTVHGPFQSKPEYRVQYEIKAEDLPPANGPPFVPEGKVKARRVQDHAVYAGMIQSLDESVGRLMAKLDQLQLAEHTVVIFVSDNGGLSTAEGSPTSNFPLRAGKGWLYEGGIRVPMIIKWPGVTRAASLCSEPVISTDFYPTMLEMAGLPLMPSQHRHGASLVPLLKDGKSLGRQEIFWHYPHYNRKGDTPAGAVRAGDYKLIEFYEDNRTELYNLKTDRSETHDLGARMPGKTKELQNTLHRWRRQVGGRMPKPNPDYRN